MVGVLDSKLGVFLPTLCVTVWQDSDGTWYFVPGRGTGGFWRTRVPLDQVAYVEEKVRDLKDA